MRGLARRFCPPGCGTLREDGGMKGSIQIEVKGGIAIATCTGALRAADAREGAQALWRTSGWSGKAAVWDFRKAQFDLSSAEIDGVARFILRNQPVPPPARIAFVTGREVDFGMGRAFEVYREDPRTAFRVFRDYDQAMLWARGQEPEDCPTDPVS